ncbi:hypothetical protein OE88DRAFT_1156075 [Heliocybe sulcata]|uniref:Uncharacterized protein n=1 Tax=Heliocybe sulcata TaxID=5364 RepID=A0A5C3NCL5_9AGAM|nr:hypothetical protein OE88DRAFT_1156075 [Heliocybe sulcata]
MWHVTRDQIHINSLSRRFVSVSFRTSTLYITMATLGTVTQDAIPDDIVGYLDIRHPHQDTWLFSLCLRRCLLVDGSTTSRPCIPLHVVLDACAVLTGDYTSQTTSSYTSTIPTRIIPSSSHLTTGCLQRVRRFRNVGLPRRLLDRVGHWTNSVGTNSAGLH